MKQKKKAAGFIRQEKRHTCLLFKRRLGRKRRRNRMTASHTETVMSNPAFEENLKGCNEIPAVEPVSGDEPATGDSFEQRPREERLREEQFRGRRLRNRLRERRTQDRQLRRCLHVGLCFAFMAAAVLCLAARHGDRVSLLVSESEREYASSRETSSILESLRKFVNGSASSSEIPESLLEFAEKYPEAADFVNSYPEKKDIDYEIDLSGEVEQGTIPLFIQWDERWGYRTYGSDLMGLNGCGPTCLSMVLCGLTGDTKWDPYSVAQYALDNEYYVWGVGTSWDLMTTGAEALGLQVCTGTVSAEYIKANLSVSTPMIASMYPGDFTYSGHFIVLTGIDEEGKVSVNDPNSPSNSAKTWTLETLVPQIRALWVYTY